jgi:CheY-like chemotaxis protein
MQGTARRSPRVLVVEDQMTVAVYIATLLEDLGCAPVGPVGHVTTALPLALSEPLDAALLDIDLAGDSVEPIADVLERRNIPYALVTAYRRDRVPTRLQGRPYLSKPFMDREIATLVSNLVGDF